MIRSLNGPTGTAIRFLGNNRPDTLTLRPGSIIEGRIRLGGGTDTLNVINGLNLASSFQGGPEIINTNGAPYAVSGRQVAVVDPTGFAMQDEVIIDLTDNVSNSVLAPLTQHAQVLVRDRRATPNLNFSVARARQLRCPPKQLYGTGQSIWLDPSTGW